MEIQGVIFDLDGVICFTDHYHYLAWKTVADQEDIYFDKEINNRLRGVSRMDSLNIILERAKKEYSEEEKKNLAFQKNEIYKQYLNNMTEKDVSKDTLITLRELKEKNIKIAIGSSSKNTKLILKKIGLLEYFDAICDGNDISKSKPDPEVFLKAAEMLHLKPEHCLVIEDASAGIEAAKAGNFTAVGIGDAHYYAKTDYPITKLKDILDIISK